MEVHPWRFDLVISADLHPVVLPWEHCWGTISTSVVERPMCREAAPAIEGGDPDPGNLGAHDGARDPPDGGAAVGAAPAHEAQDQGAMGQGGVAGPSGCRGLCEAECRGHIRALQHELSRNAEFLDQADQEIRDRERKLRMKDAKIRCLLKFLRRERCLCNTLCGSCKFLGECRS